ncbi:hypothetical protein NT1RE_14925 [Agrobacterium fabrum]|uniref:hypothetical protein n=1 Tax=Agrobacterium fabrum TaxID=1176649 RepID=UPI000A8C0E91|nr:hypothetical protein [Agrobacterium fabrum]CAD0211690.1 hypothetical protein AGTUEHA105_LOCUS3006 [Agrobacterium tumefaciens]AYM59040.1 hypothetical protein At1D132_30280 [Agrobacterium fabrum]MCX2875772.1 hypothetical protein [Agrobacterium fabrum]NMV69446.1 hypothetical protein [Agrobacterium fabrum]NSZ13118.1 hypothetical protein [Agrobacterium fabrum]
MSNSNTNKKMIFVGILGHSTRDSTGKRGREIPLRSSAMAVNTEKYSVKAEEQPNATRLGLHCRLCVISEKLIPFFLRTT